MRERDTINSLYYITKFRIHGNLRHDFSPLGKIRWFIYCVENVPCQKIIIGSTQNPTQRWANYKSTCNSQNSKSTDMAKNFMDGCLFDLGKEKTTFCFALIDHYDTTEAKLLKAAHIPGLKCRCQECNNLKD